MHAVLVHATINDLGPAREMLANDVVPGVSAAPGFQAGYWTWNDAQTNGVTMVIFDSESNARATAARVGDMVTDAVTINSIEVREVVASA